MDLPCASKFGDFSLSRFGFIVPTDRQNHTRITDAGDRYTTIGVGNDNTGSHQ